MIRFPFVRRLGLARLVTEAWLALLAFDVIRLVGFRVLHAAIRRRRAGRRRPWPGEAEILWSVDEACVWYWKRTPCLQRSAVATWLLRARGIPAQLVIGFRPLPFESHAWVEVDGQIVNDRPQYQRAFRVLDRL